MKPALRKRLQYLASALTVLLAVALLAGVWIWWQVRGSLPQIDGSRVLADVSAPVTIARDALGVPTIIGETRADVARATGFVHAQDRFFQMDLLRRRAAGELSELFGRMALEVDQSARLHGFRRLAKKVIEQATPTEREILKAYVDGVNAGLDSLGKKPWEYLALRLDPQPWAEEDSILCIYAMWFDLQDHHAKFELNRDALRRALGQSAVDFLAPAGTSWDAALDDSTFAPAALPKFRFKPASEETKAALASAPEAPFKRVVGSNAFAVSGAHTATGAALVANDMHLDFSVPHIWYRASLQWKDHGKARSMTGVSLPGVPFVVVGSNGRVAWGFTVAYVDTTDLVITELDTTAEAYYRSTESKWLKVDVRNEEIKVKGEAPVPFVARWTEWGPVIGKAEDGRFHALRWTAHDAEATNLHLMELETATTVAEGLTALHRSGIPNENAIIGDAAGAVAWTVIGKIPRRVGYDGSRAAIWSYGDRRWDGFLNADEIPVVTSQTSTSTVVLPAKDGVVWTGNNRPLGGEFLKKLGDGGYDDGQRGRQVRDGLLALVGSGKKSAPVDLFAVQLDDRALFLERWQKFLLEVLTDDAVAQKKNRAEIRDLVRQWNGHASTDSIAYRLVRAFRAHVAERTFAPFVEQASAYYDSFNFRELAYEDALWQLAHEQPIQLLNPAHRSWESLLLAAVDDLQADAKKANLPFDRFTWGARNTLRMEHPIASSLPGPLAKLFNMPAQPLAGDSDMPRVQGPLFGQSQRMVVSPGHEAEGIFDMPGGQSGHPFSKFYRAGHDAWVKAEPTPFLPGPAQHTLTLTPN
ncbi:penicillin acylase family protein [Oleiharenicola lentus]|uniref:penicillin acylase family protein n=1 Tax=Oleiharenicola lentus TaxID=2508720 RepID=UPI003F6691B7